MAKIKFVVIALILVLAAAVISFFVFANGFKNPNVVKTPEKESYSEEWLTDNCSCLEHNLFYCRLDGFEYDKASGYCVKDKEYTNPSRKCSVYNCSGEIYNRSSE